MPIQSLAQRIAQELSIQPNQVSATIDMLDEGATVPFIARYRKEKTQGLDDNQLRSLEERLLYLRELDKRRASIIETIEAQGKLTPALQEKLEAANAKTELEDLYLPYKVKRRTKAQIAREAGLEPLALSLLENPKQSPEQLANDYLNPEHAITDAAIALEGARQILMEVFAEEADLTRQLRNLLWKQGILRSKSIEKAVTADKSNKAQKFADYFDYAEGIRTIPSHRALALFRGRNEGFLSLALDVDHEPTSLHPAHIAVAKHFAIADQGRAADDWLLDTARRAWKIKIHTRLDVELKTQLKEAAEEEAIRVFASNMKDLLLAAPAGAKTTIGLDPGIRTGVKTIVVDKTGKLIDQTTLYPHAPRNQWDESIEALQKLIKKHQVELVSIGNGTASRETDKLVGELLKRYPNPNLSKIMVSEAGASVYSASELASKEYPDLDVSLRGAISIAKRLQDPLAELVKIEPKAIGVGQYQHDVNQTKLARSLDAVVEDCVNAVGVDVNMASPALLTRVAGLNNTIAENIVIYRNENGSFDKRSELKKVPRLGPKAFEQAAGFLRITHGKDPLDASAVHPEATVIVKDIASKQNLPIEQMIGNKTFLSTLKPQDYITDTFGLPTIIDIIQELEKPGRDPRPEFITATFQDGIDSINDLTLGMKLEGVVSNVTNFGAFVDIGVHQDGLVHISKLSNSYVKDPRDIVKAGDVVTVYVETVDAERKRIALSMLDRKVDQANSNTNEAKTKKTNVKKIPQKNTVSNNNAMADAFAKALK